MRRKPLYIFTPDEITLMIAIMANQDPDKFPADAAKALIYKCKSAKRDDDIIFRIEG